MRQDAIPFALAEMAHFFDAGMWLFYSKHPTMAAGFLVFAILAAMLYRWAGK